MALDSQVKSCRAKLASMNLGVNLKLMNSLIPEWTTTAMPTMPHSWSYFPISLLVLRRGLGLSAFVRAPGPVHARNASRRQWLIALGSAFYRTPELNHCGVKIALLGLRIDQAKPVYAPRRALQS